MVLPVAVTNTRYKQLKEGNVGFTSHSEGVIHHGGDSMEAGE